MAKAKKNSRPGKSKAAPKRAPRRGWVNVLSRVLAGMIWVSLGLGLVIGYFAVDLPSIDQASVTRRPRIVIVDSAGAEISSVGDNYGTVTDLKRLPPHVVRAVLAVEDRRFYHHIGIDVIGLVRALAVNVAAGRVVQGGSTITQQVAKNLFLTPQRNIGRKVREALLALRLERTFTKDQILTLYLNRVYFGAGTYGLAAAAERYFASPPEDLTLTQAAVLAGLLKAPSRYNPAINPDLARARAKIVLSTMVAAGFITADQARAADLAAPRMLSAATLARPEPRARYFADWVLGQVESFVGPVDRDIVVKTTLDANLQRMAEAALDRHLDRAEVERAVSQGAVVVLGIDGAVRAMVGGRDYAASQFNRATQALRQPGSAFKPVVYLAALKAGVSPDDVIEDRPIDIDGWRPKNFSGTFRGPVTVSEAMAQSINTVAVAMARRAGMRAVIAEARRLGFTGDIPRDYSAALGSGETTLMELTAAYAPFANGGLAALSHGIVEITDRTGDVLYRRTGDGLGPIVAEAHVAAMNRMLGDVIARGTGKNAGFDRPAAGKTGTSSDFRDAWFVGYTTSVIAGVWVGNDDGGAMNDVTGGGLPADIWRDVMIAAHDWNPATSALPGTGSETRDGISDLIRDLFRD
ncbi:MAG: PBP1A family penicillin-binding protein [Alphaproteobacteria bacterium]|nr:PBP1A family penicillin-binding protein [Alphaproteobacteria bacterium]